MKRFIPVGAALAIVALFAAAIFASGDVLSFSTPGSEVSVSEKVPADQAEPQDYNVSSESYYFGPDFMCQIFVEGNIGCYGSDAHDVVSEIPSGTGFTQIDGGETYACAYNATDRFNYCWGSITRMPSVAQPTATATQEVTAPPEATATVDPNETPEPTATVDPAATATVTPTATPEPITRTACHIPRSGSDTYPLTLTGTWVDSCTLSDGTPYIWDDWRQQGTGSVTITASSVGDPNMSLWEIDDSIAVGDEGWATVLAFNDDIDAENRNYDAQIVHNLEDGKHYWVSVSPFENSSRDSFTLTYTSTNSDLGWGASYDPGDNISFDQSQFQSILEEAAK